MGGELIIILIIFFLFCVSLKLFFEVKTDLMGERQLVYYPRSGSVC